jgi:hypothetical protein
VNYRSALEEEVRRRRAIDLLKTEMSQAAITLAIGIVRKIVNRKGMYGHEIWTTRHSSPYLDMEILAHLPPCSKIS